MKVKELIELLQKVPEDALACVRHTEYGNCQVDEVVVNTTYNTIDSEPEILVIIT